jgi:WD40 repeat protein
MRGLALSPDGATLATCGVDRFVRLWSTVDGKLQRELPRHTEELFSVAFHPDGKSLVSGDLKGNVTHWDLVTGTVSRQLDAKVLYARPKVMGFVEINDVGGVRVLAFDAAGATLACGGGEPVTSGFFTGKPMLLLFDWASGTKKQALQPADAQPTDGIVMDVSFHPQGYVVATTSGQPGAGALWCWRPGEDKPFFHNKEMAHARSASLHPDGKRLAVSQVAVKDGAGGGNGRGVDKPEDYVGLISRVRVFDTTPAVPA